MYVYDIKLCLKSEDENYSNALTDYLCNLSGNNQIIFETLNISGTGDKRVARVSTPFKDSLDETHGNALVGQALASLSKHLRAPVSIEYVGEDYNYDDVFADNAGTQGYVMRSNFQMRDLSPICCVDTRNHIPYYLLPPLTEELASALNSWETNYAAYDRLFYATGVGEISAHKMLCNAGSALNKKGMAVRQLLEVQLGKPVYYYLYRFYGKQPQKCPICGGNWKQGEDSPFAYKCNGCRLVADKTPSE